MRPRPSRAAARAARAAPAAARVRPGALLAALVLCLAAAACVEGTGPRGLAPDAVEPTTVPPLHPEVDGWGAARVTIETATGAVGVDVRVAAAPEQRRRGLMHVEAVPDGAGMLFLFGTEHTGGFWMKDTLVPLDIAFVGREGELLAVATMTPCEADPCPVHDPGVGYVAALEVPAGWFARAGVGVGDAVTWTDPA